MEMAMEDCWWWGLGVVWKSIEFEEGDGLEREYMTEGGRCYGGGLVQNVVEGGWVAEYLVGACASI